MRPLNLPISLARCIITQIFTPLAVITRHYPPPEIIYNTNRALTVNQLIQPCQHLQLSPILLASSKECMMSECIYCYSIWIYSGCSTVCKILLKSYFYVLSLVVCPEVTLAAPPATTCNPHLGDHNGFTLTGQHFCPHPTLQPAHHQPTDLTSTTFYFSHSVEEVIIFP